MLSSELNVQHGAQLVPEHVLGDTQPNLRYGDNAVVAGAVNASASCVDFGSF